MIQDAATDDGLIEVVGLTTYQLVCMPSAHFIKISCMIIYLDLLLFSLCYKREAMGHVWRNVGRHEL